uniref:Ig-like domain-containing protein n=1 Tax=Aceria tosichella TaxID=561515 RepID=A0A6G1SM89_9ACAR
MAATKRWTLFFILSLASISEAAKQNQPVMNPACVPSPRQRDARQHKQQTTTTNSNTNNNFNPAYVICPPVILNKPEEFVVGAGSNVTLSCSAQGTQPLTFVWFQDEKNLTVGTGSGNQSDPPPSTKLLEERRYEIQEEISPGNVTTSMLYLMNLKITDTSVFLCWVENSAGYTIGNFSLIVNDSLPSNSPGRGGGSGGFFSDLGAKTARLIGLDTNNSSGLQIATIIIALLVLLSTAAVICLIVLKRVSSQSSKYTSSTKSDLKSNQMSASHKFNHQASKTAEAGQMFASSDEDGITDDERDERSSNGGSSSGSQSSCRKNNTRVLAAAELDGFIDYMRSGIINMDYQSMSPVIQFNNNNQKSAQVDFKKQHQHQPQQLTQLNHFPSASNASSQHAFYSSHPSNGSNSRATTLSDLSPSSESANTSFSTTNQMMGVHPHQQQQQQHVSTNMTSNPILRQQNMTNCDLTNHHQEMVNSSAIPNCATSDYLNGYSEGRMAVHQIMPHMYLGPYHPSQMPYDPTNLIAHTSRPSSMNGRPELVQNVVFQDMIDQNGYPNGQQRQQYQMHNPPSGPFTHIL